MKKINPDKTRRFLKGISVFFVAFVAIWYLWHGYSGIYGRSSDSVKFSEWVSWNDGSIMFDEDSGIITDGKVTYFTYEERNGIVMIYAGNDSFSLVRYEDNKMITNNGKTVYYLKGEWGMD